MKKLLLLVFAVVAFATVTNAQIRITAVVPAADLVTIHNYGSSTVDISGYWFCHLFAYHQVSNGTVVSGSTNLGPGEDLVLTIAQSMNLAASDMCLYSSPSFGSPAAMVDFTQWGAGGLGRESVAVAKGIWTAGTFVPTNTAYYYNISMKGAQTGVGNWGTCPWPANLSVCKVQDTSVEVSWDHVGGAQTFRVKYREGGSGTWDNAVFAYNGSTRKTITGLTPGSQYAFAVDVNCGNGWGDMTSLPQSFRTLASPCNVPSGLSAAAIKVDKVKLDWADEVNTNKFRIRYRQQGTSSWTTAVRSDGVSHKWITGLSAGTAYEWQIKNVCEFGEACGTAWSALQMFTTATSKWDETVDMTNERLNDLRMFPNPVTNGTFTLAADLGEQTDVRLVVVNSLGAEVVNKPVNGSGEQVLTVDVSNQPAGLYVVRLLGQGIERTGKVMVK